ncbi:galactose mutarotase-like domain-containing protein [Lipomyces oligophaga]|uniref:galactose mutarotase-like domain-containing protein n=1 Tax=Lipomyces oligophaga TaxID=45792 RepID=UPI0034CF7D12
MAYMQTLFDSADESNQLHTLISFNGLVEASFSNRGASLVKFQVRRSVSAEYENVVCGFQDGKDYQREDNPFFGALIGRVSNRIAGAEFELDGAKYKLTPTRGGNCLHGGSIGYDKIVFDEPEILGAPTPDATPVIKFKYISADMEEGFPGKIEVCVSYWLECMATGATLNIEYGATLLGPAGVEHTIVNLTNHSYFNIGNEPTIAGTELQLGTDLYLELNENQIPTGAIAQYPLDADADHVVRMTATEPNLDHCFVYPDNPDLLAIDTRPLPLRTMANAYHPVTGIHLDGQTTDPAFQLYTGTGVNVAGLYGKRCGFCLESSRYVDAIHMPKYAGMVILGKSQPYGSTTKFSLYY